MLAACFKLGTEAGHRALHALEGEILGLQKVALVVSVMVLEIVFGILASLIVMWFSRQREFRADAAGARLAGAGSMIGALEALKRAHDPQPLPEKMAAFGINGGRPTGLKRLFMSHPPLDERIEALRRSAGQA